MVFMKAREKDNKYKLIRRKNMLNSRKLSQFKDE